MEMVQNCLSMALEITEERLYATGSQPHAVMPLRKTDWMPVHYVLVAVHERPDAFEVP